MSFGRIHRNSFTALAFPTLALGDAATMPKVGIAYAFRSQIAGIRNVPLSDGSYADYIDEMSYHTVGVVIDFHVQLGFGVTWINAFNSVSHEHVDAHDYGVFVRVPVLALATGISHSGDPLRIGPFNPDLSISGGYTWSSRGQFAYDLPDFNRFGLSGKASLDFERLDVLDIMFVRDEFKWNIRPGGTYWGIEFTVGGAIAFRFGDRGKGDNTSTNGFSVHSRGLTQWIWKFSTESVGAPPPWYVSIIDLYYDYAHDEFFFEDRDSESTEVGLRLDARALFAQ